MTARSDPPRSYILICYPAIPVRCRPSSLNIDLVDVDGGHQSFKNRKNEDDLTIDLIKFDFGKLSPSPFSRLSDMIASTFLTSLRIISDLIDYRVTTRNLYPCFPNVSGCLHRSMIYYRNQ
jgi:hypothetical protein